MKKEYRSLKTWREKADYLDQLILKRGPKIKPSQAKVSRFREIVGKMQLPFAQRSGISSEKVIKEEKTQPEIQPPEMQPAEGQEWANVSHAVSHMVLPQVISEPSHQETESEGETSESEEQLARTCKFSLPAETLQPIPAVTVTSSPSGSPESSEGGDVLERKVRREEISQESETSLSSSSGIPAEFSEAGDSEGLNLAGFGSQGVQEETPSTPKKVSPTEYSPEPIQELHTRSEVPEKVSDEFVAPQLRDSLTEPVQEWPWKDIGIPAEPDELNADSFKHLEKAVERALFDLGRVPESSSLQGRPNTAPGADALISKNASRSFSSVFETPRNQAGSISEMFHNQEQTLKMTPEQLEVVLRILQKVLKHNTLSQE
ncbi:uncharacterized protein LOC110089031 isoform X3 [Pogona vitticeps]